MFHAHGGDVWRAAAEIGLQPEEVMDFSANVGAVPIPDVVRQAAAESIDLFKRFPDPSATALREAAATAYGVPADHVLAGNGSTEFIYAIPRRLRPRRVVILAPCYHDYWRAIEHAGGEAEGVLASAANEFVPDLADLETRLTGVDMAFIGNPNNPTGVALRADQIRETVAKFPGAVFVVDEALVDFVPESVGASLLSAAIPKNVIVLRSLSFFHGLPGLRVGFMIASPQLCELVDHAREPWSIGPLAQNVACALLATNPDAAEMRTYVMGERERVRDVLSRMSGIRVFRSQANFLLLKVTKPTLSAAELCRRLLKQKVFIRNTAGFRGLDGKFVRLCVRSSEENDTLLKAFETALEEGTWK